MAQGRGGEGKVPQNSQDFHIVAAGKARKWLLSKETGITYFIFEEFCLVSPDECVAESGGRLG